MSHDRLTPSVPPASDPPPAPMAAKPCANCGAPMLGPYCHACGQPEKGMIRHLASVMSDVADTIFNVDSRIFRTLIPLYFRPGFLSNEYFAGRRTRYVTPFRLFFFLCVLAFFAIQTGINISAIDELSMNALDPGHSLNSIREAQTPEELDTRVRAYLKYLEDAKTAAATSPKTAARLDTAIATAKTEAGKRGEFLVARAKAIANGQATPADPAAQLEIQFDGTPWEPTPENTRVSWLPDFINARLYAAAQRAKENLLTARHEPSHLINGILSVLPQTMFVLMPFLALLLKFAYLFKRRLYMEHLMVALHSHAFTFLSLLLLVLTHLLWSWAQTHASWLASFLGVLSGAMWAWLVVYPFLMAKKVYRQGWIMTTLKFCLVGLCYVILLGLGITGATIASLAIT